MSYTILHAQTITELTAEVNDMMIVGFVPCGGIAMTTFPKEPGYPWQQNFSQAMCSAESLLPAMRKLAALAEPVAIKVKKRRR